MESPIDKDISDRIGQKIEVQITCCYVIGHGGGAARYAHCIEGSCCNVIGRKKRGRSFVARRDQSNDLSVEVSMIILSNR